MILERAIQKTLGSRGHTFEFSAVNLLPVQLLAEVGRALIPEGSGGRGWDGLVRQIV